MRNAAGLLAFLLARQDDDEAVARAAIQGPWRMGSDSPPMYWLGSGGARRPPDDVLFGQSPIRPDARVQVADLSAAWEGPANGRHIARWDPARVLAEVEAKRRILDRYQAHLDRIEDPEDSPYAATSDALEYEDWTLLALVQPHADHPDFDPEWRLP